MICLAYLSHATGAIAAPTLADILASSRRNNDSLGVTGMLCHYDGSFLQFLEGDDAAVSGLFQTISSDRRHQGILEVHRSRIAERVFSDWTMALVKPDDLGPEQAAFCQSLRTVEISAKVEHRHAIEPFLQSFRAWLR
jgi:hypothetical protein